MAYIDFESDGIEYRLILVEHGTKIKEPMDGLDALVVETGSIDQEEYAYYLTKEIELANYLKEIRERGIPIYSVDNKGKCRRDLLSMATDVTHFLIPPIIAYGVSKLAGADDNTSSCVALYTTFAELAIISLPSFLGNRISKFFAKMNSFLSLIRQSPIEELRNALTARKIKKGVVPHLLEKYPERFSDKSPKIGIIYGAAHSGIKECLENDLRAGLSLRLHKYYGLKFILDKNTLNDVYEYHLNKDDFTTYNRFQVESI